jgi:hypothetical protein
MGYTNYNGFRASYCYPYKWYSLDIESVSSLTLHSYSISEITLISESDKFKVSKMELAAKVIRQVKKYNGQLVAIFHNDTFTEEMQDFYLKFLEVANDPSRLDQGL